MFSYAVSLSCLPLVIIILLFCVMMESCFSGSVIKTFRRFSLSVLRTLAFLRVCASVPSLWLQFVFLRRWREIGRERVCFLVFYWLQHLHCKKQIQCKRSLEMWFQRGDSVFPAGAKENAWNNLFSPLNCMKLSMFSWPWLLDYFSFLLKPFLS